MIFFIKNNSILLGYCIMGSNMNFDMNSEYDFENFIFPIKLERSCTRFNCVCNIQGRRRPCQIYNSCTICNRSFYENNCKCHILKELKNICKRREKLSNMFKELVRIKSPNKLPRQFREMRIKKQNYYQVLNNPGIFTHIKNIDGNGSSEWYLFNAGNGDIVFCIESLDSQFNPIWNWQPNVQDCFIDIY